MKKQLVSSRDYQRLSECSGCLRFETTSHVRSVVFIIVHATDGLVAEDVLLLANVGCEGRVLTHSGRGAEV